MDDDDDDDDENDDICMNYVRSHLLYYVYDKRLSFVVQLILKNNDVFLMHSKFVRGQIKIG